MTFQTTRQVKIRLIRKSQGCVIAPCFFICQETALAVSVANGGYAPKPPRYSGLVVCSELQTARPCNPGKPTSAPATTSPRRACAAKKRGVAAFLYFYMCFVKTCGTAVDKGCAVGDFLVVCGQSLCCCSKSKLF